MLIWDMHHRVEEISQIEISPFQADPSIVNVAMKGGSEAILSGDSDFAMFVGPGGPDKLGYVSEPPTINNKLLLSGQYSK